MKASHRKLSQGLGPAAHCLELVPLHHLVKHLLCSGLPRSSLRGQDTSPLTQRVPNWTSKLEIIAPKAIIEATERSR